MPTNQTLNPENTAHSKWFLTFVFSCGIACLGTIGLFRTLSGLDAYGASLVRAFWGALSLFLVALIFKPNTLKTNLSFFIRCLLWGALLGLTILVFFITMDHSNQSIAALFLFLNVIWYPIYTKALFPEESQKTRWAVYLLSIVCTLLGTFLALGFFNLDHSIALSSSAIIFGFLVSVLGFMYIVVGRWLFFAENKREGELIQKFFTKVNLLAYYERLLEDENNASTQLKPFWLSYQKTLYQSLGMLLICFFYIPSEVRFFKSLLSPVALINGVALGVICLSVAFLLTTYADFSNVIQSDGSVGKLSHKIKGISTQIELVLALLLGYFVLGENIGLNGLIGCLIMVISYIIGVLYSEK